MSRSVPLDAAREIAKNVAMGVRPIRAARLRRPRAGAHFTGELEQLERYAFQGVRSLLRYRGSVEGLSVIEFGPGDTLSAGLSTLAAGAATYTALDRFVPDYSGRSAKVWYRGIGDAWPDCFPGHAWPEWLEAERFPEAYPDRVRHISGGVEDADSKARFDVVCSFQVGEHVRDVAIFASLTAKLLAPNGIAIHRVDFGPHDRWLDYSDPLTYLRFSPRTWSAMGSNRGTPNRCRHHDFLCAFADAGLTVQCIDRSAYRRESIDIARLHRRFRESPLDSLLTKDVVYLCTAAL